MTFGNDLLKVAEYEVWYYCWNHHELSRNNLLLFWSFDFLSNMTFWRTRHTGCPLHGKAQHVRGCVISGSPFISCVRTGSLKWFPVLPLSLTHWGRVPHICVGKLTIIGSHNCLSPGRHQAIIWSNAGILVIRTLGTNFSDFLSKVRAFSFKKMHLKMSSGKRRSSCLSLNVLRVLLG